MHHLTKGHQRASTLAIVGGAFDCGGGSSGVGAWWSTSPKHCFSRITKPLFLSHCSLNDSSGTSKSCLTVCHKNAEKNPF